MFKACHKPGRKSSGTVTSTMALRPPPWPLRTQLETKLRPGGTLSIDGHLLSGVAGLWFASGLGEFLQNPNPHLLFWWREKRWPFSFLKRNPVCLPYATGPSGWSSLGTLPKEERQSGRPISFLHPSAGVLEVPDQRGQGRDFDVSLQLPDYSLWLSGHL